MLALLLLREDDSLVSSVLAYIFKTACYELLQNMSPGYEILSHSLVGMHIMRMHNASSTCTNFLSPYPSEGLFLYIFLFHFYECLCILFKLRLGGALTIYLSFTLTIIAGDVVKVPLGI